MKRAVLLLWLSALAGCVVYREPPRRVVVARPEPVKTVVVVPPPESETVPVAGVAFGVEGVWYRDVFYEGAVYVTGDYPVGYFSVNGYYTPHGLILGVVRIHPRYPNRPRVELRAYHGRPGGRRPPPRVRHEERREPPPRREEHREGPRGSHER